MTADPGTGRVFYFAPKEQEFHILSAAGAAEASFEAAEDETQANRAAFNPDGGLGGRPHGVYYIGEDFNSLLKTSGRGLIFAQSEKNPPTVGGEHVTTVGATYTTLAGEVDPEGAPTTYRFEYGPNGPCSSNPCTSAPAGGAQLAATSSEVPVSLTVSGLQPAQYLPLPDRRGKRK